MKLVATVVLAIAFVLGALAVHGMHNPPSPLAGSEILTPIWPGEVLS